MAGVKVDIPVTPAGSLLKSINQLTMSKDDLNIMLHGDLQRCRKRAKELSYHGSLEGRVPVRVDSRTIIYKKIKGNGA